MIAIAMGTTPRSGPSRRRYGRRGRIAEERRASHGTSDPRPELNVKRASLHRAIEHGAAQQGKARWEGSERCGPFPFLSRRNPPTHSDRLRLSNARAAKHVARVTDAGREPSHHEPYLCRENQHAIVPDNGSPGTRQGLRLSQFSSRSASATSTRSRARNSAMSLSTSSSRSAGSRFMPSANTRTVGRRAMQCF